MSVLVTLPNNMEITSKQLIRLEKKKKKMAAFLEISKLNDNDRKNNLSQNADSDSSSEPMPKRKKKESKLPMLQEVDKYAENDEINCNEKKSDVEITQIYGVSGKPLLVNDDYLKLKMELRERKKQLKSLPRLRMKMTGEKAGLSVKIDERVPIFLSDIQHLLLYSQLGTSSSYAPSRWCQLEKPNNISHTVLVAVENFSLYHYLSYESLFHSVNSLFENKLQIITPSSLQELIEELSYVPITDTQKTKFIRKFGSIQTAMQVTGQVHNMLRAVFPITREDEKNLSIISNSDKFPRTQILLSLWQLVEENYPLPLQGELCNRYSEYVLTKDSYKKVTASSPMFGLDCEMCKTTTGNLELTRISVVDENMESIYESLVKPANKIIDYLTRFSGITPKMMEGVTKTLADVQKDIRELLPPDAILVGQSLNSDLHAMKMMHPYIIDTSVIFNISGDRVRKSKLQTLAYEFLRLRIQQRGRLGHCSTEDSTASLKLAQLKLSKTIEYGDAVLMGSIKSENNYGESKKTPYGTSLFEQVSPIKNVSIIGQGNVINTYKKYITQSTLEGTDNKTLICETVDTNKQVVKTIINTAKRNSFTLAHLSFTSEEMEQEKLYKSVDKWIQKIYNQMDINGLLIVLFCGQENNASGVAFINLKRQCRA